MDPLPNFTPRVQQAIKIAKKLCISQGLNSVDPLHLLYGILKVQDGLLSNVNQETHKTIELLNLFLDRAFAEKSKNFALDHISYSKQFKNCLRSAALLANEYDHDYVGAEHVFLCLLRLKQTTSFFAEAGIVSADLSLSVKAVLEGGIIKKQEELQESLESLNKLSHRKHLKRHTEEPEEPSLLDKYSVNLTNLALDKKLDSVISRDAEMDDLIKIICRRTKNNPIILGEAGVGKTALVEGLAQKIVDQDVPDQLLGCTIFSLNLNSIIAGTKYRGQFEERFKEIIDNLLLSDNNIIFIDEIHTLVGAGSAEGGIDASNLLKPLLARGGIKCIGATTFSEYKQSIESDKALSRRFQPVIVNEPSIKDTHLIIERLSHEYENFHQVLYRKNALKAAVDLSSRYINDRYLPDKAIDIIDEAASKVKINNFQRPLELKNIENSLESLIDQESSTEDIKKKKVLGGCIDDLFEEYQLILDDWQSSIKKQKVYVTESDIYDVISRKTSIPKSILSSSSDEKFLSLESKLKSVIIGQDAAVNSLYNSIIRSACGLNNPQKPMGVFLLLGQTGTGKTLMSKEVAKNIFGGSNSLIRLDMGEFSEPSSVAKITGSAPGYVGYNKGSFLVDEVRKNPYSVVLFDEIEKAHPEVFKSLLALLDEGSLTDSHGRKADFCNTLIILTSNLGSGIISKPQHGVGFLSAGEDPSAYQDKLKDAITRHFSPEFVNRIDEVITFQPFNDKALLKIINIKLKELNNKLRPKKIKVSFKQCLLNFLTSKLHDINLGARPIDRLLKSHIETLLAESLLKKTLTSNSKVSFFINESGNVEFSTSK